MQTYSRLTKRIQGLVRNCVAFYRSALKFYFQIRQLHIQTRAYGLAFFTGIDSVAQSRSKMFFTDNMGDESDGQYILKQCGEEVSRYIQRKWAESYRRRNKQIKSYRAIAAANGGAQ